jgi:ABC-type transporter Mla maintaining outer membrane lipid asymmetry ATPase subunit MlaF
MNEKPNSGEVLPIEMTGVDIGTMQEPEFIVLKNIHWSVARNEFWVVGAPPHSGKTDFLMTTAGLVPPARGSYKFYGNETHIFDESRLADRLRMGFVFEDAGLFPNLSVAANVALPLRYHKNLKEDEAMEAVEELLRITELKAIADVTPPNLPRGWHRRAGLARALVLQPDILLADNPLGALDARHCHWWLRFLDALAHGHKWLGEKPLTIITTTDDFRPWLRGQRQFALLKEQMFVPLGSGSDLAASNEPLVKELLAAPIEDVVEPSK